MTRSVPATDPEDLWGARASFVATGDSSCRKREPSPLHRDIDPRRSGQAFQGERTGVCFWIREEPAGGIQKEFAWPNPAYTKQQGGDQASGRNREKKESRKYCLYSSQPGRSSAGHRAMSNHPYDFDLVSMAFPASRLFLVSS